MAGFSDFLMGSPGTPESAEFMKYPQYDWTQPAYEQLAGGAMQDYQRSQAGDPPEWYKKIRLQLQQGMMDPLNQKYYGGGGQSGLFEEARGLGAAQGIGPKPVTAQVNKQMYNYGQEASAVDMYLAGLDYQTQSTAGQNAYNQIQGLPQGPQGQVVQFAGSQPTTGFLGQVGAGIGQGVGMGFGNMMGQNMFGGGGSGGTQGGTFPSQQQYSSFGGGGVGGTPSGYPGTIQPFAR